MKVEKYNNLATFIRRHFRTLLPFLTLGKGLNISAALIEMILRRKKCRSLPFVFRIDPCSACNLHCAACESYKFKGDSKRVMDVDDFKLIIGKIRKVALRASLYDGGEPLMNRNIWQMIRYATKNKVSTLISTNFNLFGKENLDDLFDSGLTVLEPCLDGFSQEKYAHYRRGGKVDLVKNGIEMVMQRKRHNNSRYPVVDVQVITFQHDDNDVQGCSTPKKDRCFWLYFGMMVKPDGRVYPCCGGDFHTFPYGSLLDSSLEEIWNNEYYRFSRALFTRGKRLEVPLEYRKIPCLKCNQYKKTREVRFVTQ